ncbi:hypothetical protein PVL30_005568 [Lodderomyces elongisporus]|uniref:uncharacterized protein n=1 Tax=Lodderomyces elongisporus TaxID=36914 RepID=UPI0029270D38|nr:uncharacterized protein PVL30_005568 [Lodderomyces elongisporus]WLF81768.1 hypothetical protein PVL30_005568 [Lodderomyces elongisporus]
MDDEELGDLDLQLMKQKPKSKSAKPIFKRKKIENSSNGPRSRILFNDINSETDDRDVSEIMKKVEGESSLHTARGQRRSPTIESRAQSQDASRNRKLQQEQAPESHQDVNKRRQFLSRYMATTNDGNDNTLQDDLVEQTLTGEEALKLLEDEYSDEDNVDSDGEAATKPTSIPNILHNTQLPFSSATRKIIPSHSSFEPHVSKRQFLKQLGEEYKDKNNYDDGSGDFEQNNNNNNAVGAKGGGGGGGDDDDDDDDRNYNNLNDEDMGVLKSQGIDFDRKFDWELQSENDAESGSESELKPRTKSRFIVPDVKILSVDEQIARISNLLNEAHEKKAEMDKENLEIIRHREENLRVRETLCQRLRDINLD